MTPDEREGQSLCLNCNAYLDLCNASGCGQRQAPGWRWPLPAGWNHHGAARAVQEIVTLGPVQFTAEEVMALVNLVAGAAPGTVFTITVTQGAPADG